MSYGKAGIRKDSWTHQQDAMLAEIVLSERKKGKTDTEAFAIAAPVVGRSASACMMRWHNNLKNRHCDIPEQEDDGAMETKHDPVHHPSHYIRNGIECIDVIKVAVEGLNGFEGYCIGNVIKYCWRWKQKNGMEDLRKAKQYIEFLVNE